MRGARGRIDPGHRLKVACLALLAALCAIVAAQPAAAATPTWTSAGDLTLARQGHEATLLADGRVLVTGGFTAVGNGYDTKAAEVYDPATNSWSSGGSTSYGRAGHTATLLANGKVLVAGGVNANICAGAGGPASAELFDPATGTWSSTGSMALGRYEATATRLQNGKVLVAGGGNRCGTVYSAAELYDPATGTWAPTGSMTTPREFQDATLLADGRVLVVGGHNQTFNGVPTAEIYNPSTGVWTATGSMATDRCCGPFVTRLADGRVMAAGGYTGYANFVVPNGPSVEIFDPATGTWSTTASLSVARSSAPLSALNDGRVLAAGGTDGTPHSSAELWNPATGEWSGTASMTDARSGHSATVLASGKVLVASGYSGTGYLTSAELYSPYVYDFTGFFSPVDAPPMQNTVKAGAAIPVKFSLDGNRGLDIFASGYPRSGSIDCDTSAPDDGIEQTVTAGSSGLSYDASLDQYTYVWKTSKGWKDTCRQLEVMLDDSSLHTATFEFK